MSIEHASYNNSPEMQVVLSDFRYEHDLSHVSVVSVLAAYYMEKGKEGLRTLPKYESLPRQVIGFYEPKGLTEFRDAVNTSTASLVLGNMVLTLDAMLKTGRLDTLGFVKRHIEGVKGTIMEKKISFTGISQSHGRQKRNWEEVETLVKEDPTLGFFMRDYYSLPYELEMVMQRNYTIRYDSGVEEQQRPVGAAVQLLMRDSFEPFARELLKDGIQQPIPQRFLDFLEGDEIREDVRKFLQGKE